ncbi:nucleotidyltransferase domain-containing protein [Cellulomonas sp. ICMP 17802]|uniref:nucleotidyltransferase domain-containing protein n=1 Tax=Cellulomonas sp. ICMP 17802 TaxID=3239199 RepID=UPI00351BE17D
MQRITYERRPQGDRTLFVVRTDDQMLLPGLAAGGFAHEGDAWTKSFPSDAPHLDRAWLNIQELLVPWLRQTVGLDPVPWAGTLASVIDRLGRDGIDWWLTGSAALAVQGVKVSPADLDLVVAGDDARAVGDLLVDGLVEPVARVDWFCDWWGRAFLGCRVEWVGGIGPRADEPEVTDFGPTAAAALRTVTWHGRPVRVPPIELQRAVSVRRGLSDRVAAIDRYRLRTALR